MSCISSNFSSFFLDSLNDPSEFAKYLSNGENKCSPFDDFQVFGSSTGSSYGGGSSSSSSSSNQPQQQLQQQNLNGGSGSLPPAPHFNNNVVHANSGSTSGIVAAAAPNSAGVHNHNNSDIYNNTLEANNFNQQQPQLAPPSQPPTTPQQQQQQQQQTQQQQHHHHQQQQQQQYVGHPPPHPPTSNFQHSNNHQLPLAPHHPHGHPQPHAAHPQQNHLPHHNHHHQHPHQQHPQHQQHHQTVVNQAQGYASPLQQRWSSASTQHTASPTPAAAANLPASTAGAQHFDGSFEFLKYLRHSNDFSGSSGVNSGALTASNNNNINNSSGVTDNVTASASASATAVSSPLSAASLLDLDTSTSMKPRSARKAAALLSSATRAVSALDSSTLDVFDHDDSKHTIFDLQHHSITNSSNSNEESSMDVSNLAFPNSLLNASNSNTSSEGAAAGSADFTNLNATASNAPKPLANFIIKENFEVHPAHKVEEGIFQHMNKLPPKKKENLKQLGVRFTGQMTLSDKSIVVENFIKFCQEYEINDHRPFLSLNQSGLNKPEQIKFARYLGQGLPSFTLFCIYSNFKNLFCTKRTETYSKEGYNLPFILDNTKHYISKSTADLKNISLQQSNDGLDFPLNKTQCPMATNNDLMGNKSIVPKVLENFLIYENFDVHDTHRVEDGVCTHITRLPPKKQEILKQFGIQSSQAITYYEKYIIIENFIKFCNEYKISDHRPFLDFHESGLPKTEQVKFVRYLGQTLPNLTLNKIYLAFRDILGLNRIEKITTDGYNLDTILRKKKKNLYGRMHAVPI